MAREIDPPRRTRRRAPEGGPRRNVYWFGAICAALLIGFGVGTQVVTAQFSDWEKIRADYENGAFVRTDTFYQVKSGGFHSNHALALHRSDRDDEFNPAVVSVRHDNQAVWRFEASQ